MDTFIHKINKQVKKEINDHDKKTDHSKKEQIKKKQTIEKQKTEIKPNMTRVFDH